MVRATPLMSRELASFWGELPPELLAIIFALLPVEERLLRIPLVCQRWRAAARLPDCFQVVDAEIWCEEQVLYALLYDGGGEDLSVSDITRRPQDALVKRAAKLGGTSLRVLHARNCSAEAIQAVASHCPNIQHLAMPDLFGTAEAALVALAKGCRRLTHLVLQPLFYEGQGKPQVVTDKALQAIADHCPLLEHVDLTACTGLSPVTLGQLVAKCPRLRCLNLDNACRLGASAVVDALVRHCFHNLQHINLTGSGISPGSLRQLATACPLLQELCLRGSPSLECALRDVAGGGQLRQLTVLDVENNPWFGDAELCALAKGCPALLSLNASVTAVTDEGLLALAQGCPGLRKLEMDVSARVSNIGASHVLRHCGELRELSLRNSEVDDAVVLLAASCRSRHLRRLAYGGRPRGCTPRHLTPAILEKFLKHCPLLRDVMLPVVDLLPYLPDNIGFLQKGEWRYFAGEFLRCLSPGGCCQLVDVWLDGPGVGGGVLWDVNAALRSWARTCPALRSLRLSEFVNLEDSTVAAIAAACPAMEEVGFMGCPLLTGDALLAVARLCPRLKNAIVSGCPLVDHNVLTQLRLAVPRKQLIPNIDVVFRSD